MAQTLLGQAEHLEYFPLLRCRPLGISWFNSFCMMLFLFSK